MHNVFMTSDHHFGHKNILEYEKEARPFSSLEEMHEVLIDRWNNVVKPNDVVYHLGDFCFGKQWISIASRLNGRKKLVMGNHDIYPSAEYLNHFEKLYGVLFWKRCVLSHMPLHPNGLGARWLLNLHGHLHSKRVMWNNAPIITERETGTVIVPPQYDENYFNVSIELHNLTPVHSDIIMDRLKEIDNEQQY